MPSKAMFEEWREEPSFEAAYLAAAKVGKQVRGGSLDEPADEAPRPAVLRGLPTADTAEKNRQLSQKLTAILGDGDSYGAAPAAREAPAVEEVMAAVATPPTSTKLSEVELQEVILAKITAGAPPTSLLKGLPGYGGLTLAKWRKDPAFKAAYEQAKAAGKGQSIPAALLVDPPVPPEAAASPPAPPPLPQGASSPPPPTYCYKAILGRDIPGAADTWCSMEQALSDAEYLAKKHNRAAYVAQIRVEVLPAVSVREL